MTYVHITRQPGAEHVRVRAGRPRARPGRRWPDSSATTSASSTAHWSSSTCGSSRAAADRFAAEHLFPAFERAGVRTGADIDITAFEALPRSVRRESGARRRGGRRSSSSVSRSCTRSRSCSVCPIRLGLPARGVIHLGELAAVVAVALCGAAGTGCLGRLGLARRPRSARCCSPSPRSLTVAATGLSDTLFAIAPLLVGVGLVLAGIAVLRAGVWTARRRYVRSRPRDLRVRGAHARDHRLGRAAGCAGAVGAARVGAAVAGDRGSRADGAEPGPGAALKATTEPDRSGVR